MKRAARRIVPALLLSLGALALALPAQAAGIDDFKLTRAIPADAALVVHARDHAGLAFLNEQYARVWKVVEEQHFEKDLRTLLKGLFEKDGGDPEVFEQRWQQFSDLLLGVEWGSLFEREFAFALKLSFPMPEMIVLGQSSPDKAQTNFAGLEAIVKAVLRFVPEGAVELTTQGQGQSVVHTVRFPGVPVPLGELLLAREKDVLMLGFGQIMPEQTLALLRGEPGQTLAATERFRAAFKQLPPPTDELFFMDVSRYLGQIRAMVEAGMAMGDPTGEALDPKIKALPGRFVEALDVFEYIAASTTTEGMKTTAETVFALTPNAASKPLYPVIFGNGSIQEPLRWVPQEAQECTVWSGLNLKALYDGILAFIRDNVPDGQNLLAQWEQAKLAMPVSIEDDILSWVGGGVTYFAMPARSAYQPGPWVIMLSVTDEAKAREVLSRIFAAIEPFLTSQSGALRDAQIEGAEGFKVVVHPMLAMLGPIGQPTIGVHGGKLIWGSSEKIIAATLATAAGQAPNFGSNERFQKEGLPVAQDVVWLSFTDQTKLGEEWGQLLTMVPMIGMFVPEIAQNPVGRAAMSAASKAGRVIRELNFYQSTCTQTTFDGKVMYTKAVTNYRQPPKPETTAPVSPGEQAEEPTEEE